MGNFGSYEQAIEGLKTKQDVLREQLIDMRLNGDKPTSATIGILAGLDLAIKYIEQLLVDEMRIMEGHYLQEAERNQRY